MTWVNFIFETRTTLIVLIGFLDDFIDDMVQDEESSGSHARHWQGQDDELQTVDRFFAGRRPTPATVDDTHLPEYPPNILLPNILKPTDYLIWQVACRVRSMIEWL